MTRYLLALFFALGLTAGITTTRVYKNNQIKEIKLDIQKNEIAVRDDQINSLYETITAANNRISELDALNRKHTGELNEALDKNREVADRIARGDLVPRVRIKAPTCPDSPFGYPAGSGELGNEHYAELDPVARQDFLNLRTGIIRVEAQVKYLQDYIKQTQKSPH